MNIPSQPSTQLVLADDSVPDAMVIPQEDAQLGMSLQQFMAILAAYWKISVLIAFTVVFLAGVVVKQMAKTYTAIATLMISYDVNDPLAAKEFPNGMVGGYIATQIELMQSPEVLDPVIERLHLVSDTEYAAGNRGGEATLRDWVETKLRKDLDIEEGHGGSQFIYISASARSATLAADIANAIAEVYTEQQYQRMSGPASERAKRYTEELADLKNKVSVAQEAVTQFRGNSGAIDLDTKVDVEMDVLATLEHRLVDARNALRTSQAHAMGNQETSAPALASGLIETLREEAATLNSRMAKLRTTLGPNHPQVIELQSEIDANNKSLSAALATYSSAASSDIVVSSSEVSALEKAVGAQRQKVLQDRRFRDEGAKYQLELESAQTVYKRALEGYDQTMFASTGHFTNVNITSPARPPVTAERPKPIKYLLLAAILGAGLGIAAPFAFELLHRRVRCRDDVERDFGIPVLAEFEASEPARAAA